MEKPNEFLSDLLGFLTTLAEGEETEITPDTDLIDSGVIDSLSIVQMLSFIEDKLSVSIGLEELGLDSVRTPRGIDQFFNASV